MWGLFITRLSLVNLSLSGVEQVCVCVCVSLYVCDVHVGHLYLLITLLKRVFSN